MKILGVDPGLQRTGYALIEASEKIELLEIGFFSPKGGGWQEGAVEIADSIAELVERIRPVEAAIENVYTFLNPSSALKLAQLKGAIIYVLKKKGIQVAEYPPAAVKKAITGRGNASKTEVKNFVEKIVGRKLSAGDTADALSVAITHFLMRGNDRLSAGKGN